MSYFSFLDTTFRRIHFNFDSHLSEGARPHFYDFLKSFEGSNKQKAELADYLRNEISKNDLGFWILHAHEYCHFLQTFFYPYLYLLSYFQFKALIRFPIQVKETKEDIDIDKIWFSEKIDENFKISSQKFPFYWNGNELTIPESEQGHNIRWFSLNDFVENATSIFQFQIITDNKSNYDDYYEWISYPSNKVYKNVYLFLEKKVGKATAFNMIRKLTQVMFRTTDPVPVFRSLVNYWIKNHSDKEDLEIEYLEVLVNSIKQESSIIDLHGLFSVFDLPETRYIGLDDFLSILVQTEEYPLSHLIKSFVNKYNIYEEYNNCIIEIDREKFFKLYYNDFKPHLVQYYFQDLELNLKPLIELCDNYFEIKINIKGKDIGDFYYVLNNQMKIADTSFEIIQSKSDDLIPMNCSIKECPIYHIKLCRTWKSTPKNYNDCTFPIFFKLLFSKKIDAKNRKLLHIEINEQELEKEYKEKLDLHNNIARVNFAIIYNRNVLIIPKDELINDASDYFNLFIKILIEDKDYSYKDLFNSVFIQFKGFEDDKREVYEIPEIVNWVFNLKESIPELFYYLNWEIDHYSEPPKTQPTVILPMFLKYIKHELGFQFTENVFEFLTKKQLSSLIDFCLKKELDPKETIQTYIDNIIYNLKLAYGN